MALIRCCLRVWFANPTFHKKATRMSLQTVIIRYNPIAADGIFWELSLWNIVSYYHLLKFMLDLEFPNIPPLQLMTGRCLDNYCYLIGACVELHCSSLVALPTASLARPRCMQCEENENNNLTSKLHNYIQ